MVFRGKIQRKFQRPKTSNASYKSIANFKTYDFFLEMLLAMNHWMLLMRKYFSSFTPTYTDSKFKLWSFYLLVLQIRCCIFINLWKFFFKFCNVFHLNLSCNTERFSNSPKIFNRTIGEIELARNRISGVHPICRCKLLVEI